MCSMMSRQMYDLAETVVAYVGTGARWWRRTSTLYDDE
jgi:hypothetical protein